MSVGLFVLFLMLAALLQSHVSKISMLDQSRDAADKARKDAEAANLSKTNFLAFLCHGR